MPYYGQMTFNARHHYPSIFIAMILLLATFLSASAQLIEIDLTQRALVPIPSLNRAS